MIREYLKIEKAKEWYARYERRISSGSLLFGFIFDSLTLSRVDSLRDNLWMFFNLSAIWVSIIVLTRLERRGINPDETKSHFWFTNIMQFAIGNLLGTLFIFYFWSANFATAWPFFLILFCAIAANELLQKRYSRLTFQAGFLYFAILLLTLLLLPVLLHKIGIRVFILGSIVSLMIFFVFLKTLKIFAHQEMAEMREKLMGVALGILVFMNVLYFTNLIPPIPLSLKQAGIYHSVSRNSTEYILEKEKGSWRDFFRIYDQVHISPGASLSAYSAIFSPAQLNVGVIHEWQAYDEIENKWITHSRIPLSVSGGRLEGFRTYSIKSGVSPGKWRVNVKTNRDQTIGRINFRG